MKKLLLLLLPLLASTAYGQKVKKEDLDAIKAMCGCYEITFNFVETFSPHKNYPYHDRYKSGGLEYVFVVEESKDKVVLQHLLIVGDTMIIKHWRQDWQYQATDLYVYDAEYRWQYQSLSPAQVKGQWTQRVFQVDDSPRYEASATWIHADGRHYWEATADAPLPRREHTTRSDYNVMVRTNHHEITEYGWLHEEDNQKVKRSVQGDCLLAWEKGWNTYVKTDPNRCEVAQKWWTENQAYWAIVRAVWTELFASKQEIALQMRAGDKLLFQRLFALEQEWKNNALSDADTKAAVKAAIRLHLQNERLLSAVH